MKSNNEKLNIELPKIKKIPVLKIRMMSDDEWNRLAYRNRLERRVSVNA